ncbi:hypothetical protein [Clostridium sp. JN-9]|uniref:hypothetical protein n=1 Tax=Clostridium sp. JN-9 TaxID=2507159 RepID=UPI00196B47AB|nr:hypothetical protein [Clostridium sp. JN-9]
MIIIFLFINMNSHSFASNKGDLIDSMVKSCNGNIQEYGIRFSFNANGNGEEICSSILKKINPNIKDIDNVVRNDKLYCIEIKSNIINGYIESINYDNYNVVTVNLTKKDNVNNLTDFKKDISSALSKDYNVNTYFMYIKFKVDSQDLEHINEKLGVVIKEHGGTDIQTVQLENGFSSTAYTGRYSPIKSAGRSIDLNYAVCKYPSGIDVIIGTPEILTSY